MNNELPLKEWLGQRLAKSLPCDESKRDQLVSLYKSLSGQIDRHPDSTWRYEESTRTIRSVPENYWIATMDSWDGMVDNKKNGKLIAAAPELLQFAINVVCAIEENGADTNLNNILHDGNEVIAKASN